MCNGFCRDSKLAVGKAFLASCLGATASALVFFIMDFYTEQNQLVSYLSIIPLTLFVVTGNLGILPIPFMLPAQWLPIQYRSICAGLMVQFVQEWRSKKVWLKISMVTFFRKKAHTMIKNSSLFQKKDQLLIYRHFWTYCTFWHSGVVRSDNSVSLPTVQNQQLHFSHLCRHLCALVHLWLVNRYWIKSKVYRCV